MESSPTVSWIHERMPAILDTDEDVANLLDSVNVPLKEALSKLKPSSKLCIHAVSTAVNSVKNQDRRLSQAIDLNQPKPLTGSGKFMDSWLSRARKTEDNLPVKDQGTAKHHLDSIDVSDGSLPSKKFKTEKN